MPPNMDDFKGKIRFFLSQNWQKLRCVTHAQKNANFCTNFGSLGPLLLVSPVEDYDCSAFIAGCQEVLARTERREHEEECEFRGEEEVVGGVVQAAAAPPDNQHGRFILAVAVLLLLFALVVIVLLTLLNKYVMFLLLCHWPKAASVLYVISFFLLDHRDLPENLVKDILYWGFFISWYFDLGMFYFVKYIFSVFIGTLDYLKLFKNFVGFVMVARRFVR